MNFDEIEPMTGIIACCCDRPECNMIHLFIENDGTTYGCMLSIETTEWLIAALRGSIEQRKHSSLRTVN
jgi:hypothetical protein